MEPVFGDYNFQTKAYLLGKSAHEGQVRKFTGEPYFTHCVRVAELVYLNGGSDYQQAAAYLHDVIEDCGVTKEEIAERVDPEVAEIVWNCTDTPGLKGIERRTAKLKFMKSLPVDDPALLIMMCDTIHNLESCRDILKQGGTEAFSSFSASYGIMKYYAEKIHVITTKLSASEGSIKAYGLYSQISRDIMLLLSEEEFVRMINTKLWEPYD